MPVVAVAAVSRHVRMHRGLRRADEARPVALRAQLRAGNTNQRLDRRFMRSMAEQACAGRHRAVHHGVLIHDACVALETDPRVHVRDGFAGEIGVAFAALVLRVGRVRVVHATGLSCDAHGVGPACDQPGIRHAVKEETQQLVVLLNAAAEPRERQRDQERRSRPPAPATRGTRTPGSGRRRNGSDSFGYGRVVGPAGLVALGWVVGSPRASRPESELGWVVV